MTWRLLAIGSVAPIEGVLTWLVQSTVLLAVGLMAGRLLRGRGPAVQSTVYRTILVAIFLSPVASMAIAAMGFPGLVIRVPTAAADVETKVTHDGSDRIGPIARHGSSPIATLFDRTVIAPSGVEPTHVLNQLALPDGVSATAEPPSILVSGTTVAPVESPTREEWTGRVGSIVLAGWLVGTAFLALRLLVGHRRMARLRGMAIRAEPEAEALCHELARRMRLTLPGVLRSPFLCSPCLDGLRRPAILLPEDAEQHLRNTFVHELAHLARRDGLWNLLRHSATAAMWVQPLLWMLSRRIEVTAEEVCDDFVVAFGADRGQYAGHLLELAERRLPWLAPSGVGMVSVRSLLARRIARILDSTRSLSTRAGRRAIAATLLAGLAGTILAGLLGVGGQDHEALADKPKAGPSRVAGDSASTTAGPPRTSARQTVRGRVVGPGGQPVAGARVTIARYRKAGIGHYGQQGERQELDHAVADAAGRFLLNRASSDLALAQGAESPDRWRDTFIVARAPGFGPAWVWVAQGASELTEDQPLQLARDDIPITGRIVDLEGRPVAGVSLRLLRLQQLDSPEAADHQPKSAAMVQAPAGGAKPRPREHSTESMLPGNEPAVSVATTTDADGRFRLTGIGRDRLANLSISGPTIAFQRVEIATRRMKAVAGRPPDAPAVDDRTLYGADCTIVAGPSRPIAGVVRDADTKAPIAGAVVTAMQLAGSLQDIEGLISAVADAEGRYRLVGLPKASGHRLSVYPPLDRPYFITQFLTVSEGPGLAPVRYDIALKSGIWIAGRVTDVQTGQPVQAALHYYPFLANERARDYRNFDANSESFEWTGNRYRTDPQGRFRVVGLPGGGILAAKTFDRSYRLGIGADAIPAAAGQPAHFEGDLPTYNHIHPRQFQALAEINPPADVQEFRRDLAVEPLPSLTVQLVDPEGKPLTHVEAWGRFPDGIDLGDLNLYGQSRTRVVGLEPGKSRTVVFQHPGRKLGAVLVIKSGEAAKGDERTVVLRPCATVTGRVVDADGKPVTGGVQIRLAKGEFGGDPDLTLLPVPLGGDGRFRIDDLVPGGSYSLRAMDRMALGLSASGKMAPPRFKPVELARDVKLNPGQLIDLGTFDAATGQAIKTPGQPAAVKPDRGKISAQDVPITGRIVDLEGRPIRGVTVQVDPTWVGPISKARGGDLTPWLEAVRRGEPPGVARRHLEDYKAARRDLDDYKKEHRGKAETDAHGRFRLEGLGAEKVVRLSIEGLAVAHTQLQVVTRQVEPFPAQGFSNWYGPGPQTIYGADFTFTAAPGRVIEGVVRDAADKKVMKGVEVWSYRFSGSSSHGMWSLKTRTDVEGRFRLAGFPKGRENELLIVPNDDQPYFMQEFAIPDPPGLGPMPVEINLHKGIWIEGKITNKETGAPVAGTRLQYLPFLANEFALAVPEFHPNGTTDGVGHQHRYVSKADGSYRLVGLPGRAIVGALAVSGKPYRQGAGAESIKGMDEKGRFATWMNPIWASRNSPTSMKEINPPEGTATVHLDLELDAGAQVHLRLVDSQGKPVTGVKAAGRRERGAYDLEAQPRAGFDVVTLSPGEDRMVLLVHDGRKLGRVIHVKERDDEKGPVVVTLEPTATIMGRIVDADGNPVSGATIRTNPEPDVDFSINLPQIASDKDGKFTVPDVPTGCEYSLAVESGATPRRRRSASFQHAAVRPGQTTDVGDLRFGRDGAASGQAIKTSEQPTSVKHDQGKVTARDVPITGRIVDLEGRPVRGVTIQVDSTSTAKGGDLSPWLEAARRGEPSWVAYRHIENDTKKLSGKAETDAQGRFRIEALGAEKVVTLSIEGPSIAHTHLEVVTRRVEPFPARGFTNSWGPGPQTVYGADFTFTAAPGRVVEGVVRDEQTKTVMKDVGVWSFGFAGSSYVGTKSLKTRTDAEGRFHLAGLPKGHGNTLLIVPNDDQPYFMRDVAVPDPPGIGAIPIEIYLHKGIWIEGKLTDKETGSPVAGAFFHYLPFLDNKFAGATPEFRGGVHTPGFGYQDRYLSKADGSYRLVGLPGRAIVGAVVYTGKSYRRGAGAESIEGMDEHGHFPTSSNPVTANRYFPTSMKEINPAEGTETVHLDIVLDPGAKVHLRVVDPQGKPVTGVKTGGRRDRGHYGEEAEAQAAFDVVTLGPGEDRMVWLVHEGRKLGRVIQVKEGDDKNGPVVVTLEPSATITGRIVDADGNPVSGATIRPGLKPGGDYSLRLPQVAAGKDGRFTVPDVPTGYGYSLVADSEAMMSRRRYAFKDAAVRPGETTDVGDIQLKD